MPKFESKAIFRAEYDEDIGLLQIWFQKSGPYDFCNVPSEIWSGLLEAESKGQYYNVMIRDKYAC